MKNSWLLICFCIAVCSCKKNKETSTNEAIPTGTTVMIGNFTSNAHTTTGSVKVIDNAGKKYLVFENFKTDNGPALEVWISKNTGATDAKSLGTLKATSGNFSYELASDQNTSTYNHVLIWCKDFSVLFGHGILQ
jgi:Electron transfer DM13